MKKVVVNKKSAFTIIEIMVAISISVVLILIVNRFIVQSYKAITFNTEQEQAIEEARDALGSMVKEIRGANLSEQGAYSLSNIQEQEFTYYSDIDGDKETEKIRYFLDFDNSVLKRVIVEPGLSRDYNGAGATSTIANYVNNQDSPLFIYYDSNNLETGFINEVRLINIQLKINVTPARAPNDYWARTDVYLRNLRNNS